MNLISKTLTLGTIIGGAILAIGSLVCAIMTAGAGSGVAKMFMLAFVTCGLVSFIGQLVLVHRLWSTIEQGMVRTTPGKAVGFLFVPFFNLYWIFQAYWGWAIDANTYVEERRINAPRVRPGVALAFCILWIVSSLPLINAITFPLAFVFLAVFLNNAIDCANGIITAHMVDCGLAIGQGSTPPGAAPENETPPCERAA